MPTSSTPMSHPRALICPHAGYSYCGKTAAYSWKTVDPSQVDRVFLLGPSHHAYLQGCAVSPCTEYATPFGNIPIDKDISAQLTNTGQFATMEISVDEAEHSLEMHLPYLKHILSSANRPWRLVPILVGQITPTQGATYGKILAPFFQDPRTLFVISSDFCHWGRRSVVPPTSSFPVLLSHHRILALLRFLVCNVADSAIRGTTHKMVRSSNPSRNWIEKG